MPGTVLLPGNSGVIVHETAIWDVTKMSTLPVEQMEIIEDNLGIAS